LPWNILLEQNPGRGHCTQQTRAHQKPNRYRIEIIRTANKKAATPFDQNSLLCAGRAGLARQTAQ
jgi:hypothetical protein